MHANTMDEAARERAGGAALLAGAAMGLVTMALHPTGHAIMRDPTGAVARLSEAVHLLALGSVPVAFLGALALTRRLRGGGALAELGLCFHGAGAVATMVAAMASGLLATPLAARAAGESGAAREATLLLLRYSGLVNQASARVLVVMTSLAIALWSVAILRTRRLRAATGVVGVAVAGVTLALVLAGRLPLDVHGFGAVLLGQAVWLTLAGVELRRPGGPRGA